MQRKSSSSTSTVFDCFGLCSNEPEKGILDEQFLKMEKEDEAKAQASPSVSQMSDVTADDELRQLKRADSDWAKQSGYYTALEDQNSDDLLKPKLSVQRK